jgi:hypothetical protein
VTNLTVSEKMRTGISICSTKRIPYSPLRIILVPSLPLKEEMKFFICH